VRADWLLGVAYLAEAGDHDNAERHLSEALTRCRAINNVEHEADILIDLARLRAAKGERDEAQRLAQEAVEIAERCGYVLQAADAHLELAKLAMRDLSGLEDPTGLALHHAREARTLAACDGESYVYRVAYDEAGALIEKLSG
jgi:tetratricopeptide (TPR) repeat protein